MGVLGVSIGVASELANGAGFRRHGAAGQARQTGAARKAVRWMAGGRIHGRATGGKAIVKSPASNLWNSPFMPVTMITE
jgi:hypothetical protein